MRIFLLVMSIAKTCWRGRTTRRDAHSFTESAPPGPPPPGTGTIRN